VSRHFGPRTLRTQDIWGFRHYEIGAEISGQIGTNAELSRRHFGTSTELSRPPANIFVTVGRTKGLILLVIIIKVDH